MYDGSLIREKEIVKHSHINAIDISPDGASFITGGSDKTLLVCLCFGLCLVVLTCSFRLVA